MCKKVDPGGDDASVPVVECESDAYVNADNTLTPYDWFLHDPIHLRNSSSRNPSSMPPAACSLPALCQIFQKPSRGRMLPAPKTGNNNLSRDSMNLDSIPRRVSPFWKPTKMDISMHTELNLFQTFPEAALEQPYWAFPVILRRHMVHGFYLLQTPITVQGCHGKLSSPWAAPDGPDLSFAEQYAGFDLNLEVRKYVESLIRDRINMLIKDKKGGLPVD